MATLAAETTKVRHLLDQTSSSDTQFDDTNFIAVALNDGRRAFARILPEEMIPALQTTGSISLTAGFGAFPADFFRHIIDPYVVVGWVAGSAYAPEVKDGERWRLRFMIDNALTTGSTTNGIAFYTKYKTGLQVWPSAATTVTFPYIKEPTDLGVSDNTDLPEDVNNMVVEFAFERCMGTPRGDLDLAVYIAKKRGIYLQEAKA